MEQNLFDDMFAALLQTADEQGAADERPLSHYRDARLMFRAVVLQIILT